MKFPRWCFEEIRVHEKWHEKLKNLYYLLVAEICSLCTQKRWWWNEAWSSDITVKILVSSDQFYNPLTLPVIHKVLSEQQLSSLSSDFLPTLLPASIKSIPLGCPMLCPVKPKRKISSPTSFLLTYLVLLEKVISSPASLPKARRLKQAMWLSPSNKFSPVPWLSQVVQINML